MAIDLFDGSDPSDNEADLSTIKIDEKYAKRMEHNKQREALHRLQALKKRGLAGVSDDSSTSDEDNEDEELNKSSKIDLKFFETLVRVKRNDPEIFRKDVKIYSDGEEEEEEEGEKPRTVKKERPLYLKDVNARHLIDEGPEFEEKRIRHDSKVYNKEQAEGIKAFLEAEKAAFSSFEDDDDILKVKEKAEEAEMDEDTQKLEQNLNDYFGKDDDLNDNEKFLKDYLRNSMWVDEVDRNPSLNEVFDFSENEEELEKQDRYEAEYNFRFEQGGADRVLGHSRVVEASVRKKESSRKLQRKSKEERMALAEFERKQELKHLKNLKKKEIQEKLEKIRAIAGIGDDAAVKLDEDDLEEEFDPEEYDKKMKEMFGDAYYDAEDADPEFEIEEGDLEKPDFEKEDELLGLPKCWVDSGHEGFQAARERFLKQREEEDEEEKDEAEKEDGKRKRKRKISLKEKVELDKELEEYYKLDYEDTIGDLKTRFKYRSVPANRYGLKPEEILMAKEKDLNQYVSLKKIAPYREKEWKVTYHQRLKKDLIIHGENSGKSSNKKHKLTVGTVSAEFDDAKHVVHETEEQNGEMNNLSRRSKRRRRQAELKLSKSRLMAYGKIPSKPKKKR